MNTNWQLYYDYSEEKPRFAEVRFLGDKIIVRKGRIFTHGTSEEVDSLDGVLDEYELSREWNFDPEKIDFDLLEVELEAACLRVVGSSNALAIITDGSVMTIGLAVAKFEDLDNTDDGALWVVDEWGNWIEDGGLDPAFRWLLAHRDLFDYDSDDYFESWGAYRDRVLDVMERSLRRLPSSVRVKLVSVCDSALGYKRSVRSMDEPFKSRLEKWLGQ